MMTIALSFICLTFFSNRHLIFDRRTTYEQEMTSINRRRMAVNTNHSLSADDFLYCDDKARTQYSKQMKTECAKKYIEKSCKQIKEQSEFKSALKQKLKDLSADKIIDDLNQYMDSIHCHVLKFTSEQITARAKQYGDRQCFPLHDIKLGSLECSAYAQKYGRTPTVETILWRHCALGCFARIAFWYVSDGKSWSQLVDEIDEEAENMDPDGFALDGFESQLFFKFYTGMENKAKLDGEAHCMEYRDLQANDWHDIIEGGAFCHKYAKNKWNAMDLPAKHADEEVVVEDIWLSCAFGCYAWTIQERGYLNHKWENCKAAIEREAEKYGAEFYDEKMMRKLEDNWFDAAKDAALDNAHELGNVYYGEKNLLKCGQIEIVETALSDKLEKEGRYEEFLRLAKTECVMAFVDAARENGLKYISDEEEIKKKLDGMKQREEIFYGGDIEQMYGADIDDIFKDAVSHYYISK